jgi:hypothetical protein
MQNCALPWFGRRPMPLWALHSVLCLFEFSVSIAVHREVSPAARVMSVRLQACDAMRFRWCRALAGFWQIAIYQIPA